MTHKVIYRPLKQSDYDGLKQLVQNEWYDDYIVADEQATLQFVQFDLYSCLVRSSFGYVATIDDEIVGMVLGRIQAHPPKLATYTKDITDTVLAMITLDSPVATELTNNFQQMKLANRTMMAKVSSHYEAEVVLFIVSATRQGNGIGSHLWQLTQEEFSQHNIQKYYLFTDIWCNYGFYDYKRLDRIGDYSVEEADHKPAYFLYGGKTSA